MGLLAYLVIEHREGKVQLGDSLLWTCVMEPVVLCAYTVMGRWNGAHCTVCILSHV